MIVFSFLQDQRAPGIPVTMVSAAAPLSFLKQTHRAWTERDISKALNLSSAEGKQAIAAMQLQGYAEPITRTQKWRTTEQCLAVSGAKSARFTREAVEQALANLADRIQTNDDDPNSEYAVSEAVALGDFLSDQPRVQAADVGIRLTPRNADSADSGSAVERSPRGVPKAAS
jgi:hypothetical protein